MSSPAKVRVFLVDDHPIVRRGFQLLLTMEPDLVVCGEADNAPAALRKMLELRPDIAIVDLSLKSGSGLELIKQIRAQGLKTKLLVFTMRSDSIYADHALRAGANGYLTKDDGTEKAIAGIRLLMQGKPCVSETLAEAMMARLSGLSTNGSASCDALTDRELEVLQMLGEGLGTRQIAGKLKLSIKTVESHREHIKAKLGLKRATELVSYAHDWVRGR